MTMIERLLHGPLSWTDSAIMVVAMAGLETVATRIIKNAIRKDEVPTEIEEVAEEIPVQTKKRSGVFRY